MRDMNTQLIYSITEYYSGDPARIQHFMKVYEYAKLIGQQERLDAETQHILETAAIVHDIGIKPAEEKYHSSASNYQELEGPPVAEKLLISLLYKKEIVDRVTYLVGRHHTYDRIDGKDYQILVEADFLVNLYEDNCTKEQILRAKDHIFKTETGLKLLDLIYKPEE